MKSSPMISPTKPNVHSYKMITSELGSRGSVLTEYVTVMLGLIIVFLALDTILEFIVEHNDEFSKALQLPF